MENTQKKKTIVFVCTGNTCRSPMAEAVFRSELKRRQLQDAEAYSAGISACGNGRENINEKSVTVLLENGLSVENFHARRLDTEIMQSAFAIVCMTDEQRDYLMELRWNCLRKAGQEEIENNVYSFSDVCGYEIPDPYGGSIELYRKTYSLINEAMPPLFEKIFPAEQPKTEKKKRGRPRKNPESGTAKKRAPRKTPTKKKKNDETKPEKGSGASE